MCSLWSLNKALLSPNTLFFLHQKFNNKHEVYLMIVVDQLPSCVQLCTPMDCSQPGLPVPHHLPKFAPVHVHCIGDTIQPSHPLMPSAPVFSLSQHEGLLQWKSFSNEKLSCLHQMTKILELQLQHQWFGWFDGLSGVFSSTMAWRHQFFGALPSLRSSSHNRI